MPKLALAALLVAASAGSVRADILHLVDRNTPAATLQAVDAAAAFYGTAVRRVQLADPAAQPGVAAVIASQRFDGIILSSPATGSAFAELLRRSPNARSPLLISDIGAGAVALDAWSGGRVRNCVAVTAVGLQYSGASSAKAVVRQLSGIEIPHVPDAPVCYFETVSNGLVTSILSASQPITDTARPIFVTFEHEGRPTFLLSRIRFARLPESAWAETRKALWEATPVLMFVGASDRGHFRRPPGHYAALVIDDAWLTEPYGYLSYRGLVREMQKVRFHTSIAFIPWYYERSRQEVVEVFRAHPDKLSISVHGNNHDRREFRTTESMDFFDFNIAQALTRMDRFTALTGIPYDRVMVFPRGIVPKSALRALKQRNFAATMNGSNVPSDATEPRDLQFYMRPATLAFEDFLNVKRILVGSQSPANIALEIFLDNPLVFYAHHDMFRAGMHAFNDTAAFVNRIEPRTRWTGLADIVKHLYMVRELSETRSSVDLFAPVASLENTAGHVVDMQLEWAGASKPPGGTVDNRSFEWVEREGKYGAAVAVAARSSAAIVLRYPEVPPPDGVGVQSSPAAVYVTRKLTDFRDGTLSTNAVGRRLIDAAYAAAARKRLATAVLFGLMLAIAWAVVVRRRAGRGDRVRPLER